MPRAAAAATAKPHSGVGVPVAVAVSRAAAGCFADAISILKTDLETHQRKAAEIEALIGRLSSYANGADQGALFEDGSTAEGVHVHFPDEPHTTEPVRCWPPAADRLTCCCSRSSSA